MARLAIATKDDFHHGGTAAHSGPRDRAFTILHLGFTALPILAGLDKVT